MNKHDQREKYYDIKEKCYQMASIQNLSTLLGMHFRLEQQSFVLPIYIIHSIY